MTKLSWYSTLILVTGFLVYVAYVSVWPIIAQAQANSKYKNWYYIGEKNPMGQCRMFDERPCGISLYGCTDGRLRYCLTNVWVKE